jgi:hypothetical protein
MKTNQYNSKLSYTEKKLKYNQIIYNSKMIVHNFIHLVFCIFDVPTFLLNVQNIY